MHKQKTVLITAGASGIGLAIAKAFLADGAQVHICDICETAIANVARDYPHITTTVADVAQIDQVDRLYRDINELYGRLNILVNNVGVAGPTAALEDIDPHDWQRTLDTDLNSLFYVSRQAVPLLKAARGCMLNMASNAALFGFPLRSPYVAAKWAMIGLTKTWAMELGPFGVRVNALCPGSVNGPRIDSVIAKDAEQRGLSEAAIRDVYLRQNSLRVFVEAEDIAKTVIFLCSKAGRHISGQAIPLDGHTEGLSNWLD
ncbi:MAG: SDR family oxidoreductase [Cellvibrionales bacterium]|nr:SDR family oxidoreductase [Porticoccaceae bacterium]